jgi:hypothetical protein
MRLENLFFDAAVEIVKRHLEKGDIEKLEQVITCSRKSGWMPLFEGKIPWPASTETFPCQPIPKYRFLDVALTLYLREARIKSADHLKSIVEKGFFQFSGPLPIFQALHLVFAAREVSFDRLKIQNGPKQAWLPTRSQMIIKAKKVLAYAKR